MGKRLITPENITELKPNEVFIFGSNPEGRHGAGAALLARQKFGAKYGQAKGLQGQSYGIVTKELRKGEPPITLEDIEKQIYHLFTYVKDYPDKLFLITKIGCSLAYFTEAEIAGVFKVVEIDIGIPKNVALPKRFWELMGATDVMQLKENSP